MIDTRSTLQKRKDARNCTGGQTRPAPPGPSPPPNPPPPSPSPSPSPPPITGVNVVFFFPAEVRAESLSVYGHPLAKTPNYDRLAAEGIVFTNVHALHTQCSPSRAAMVTGRYVHSMGHRTSMHLVRYERASIFSLPAVPALTLGCCTLTRARFPPRNDCGNAHPSCTVPVRSLELSGTFSLHT